VLDVGDVITMARLARACLKRRDSVSWFVMLRPVMLRRVSTAMSFDATQPISICA